MNLSIDGIRQALARLSPRERTLISYAAVVVLVGAAWSLIDWSLNEHERVSARLPEARAGLARMQADAAQLHDLSTRRAPTWPGADQASAIVNAASRTQDISLEVETAGNRVRLSGTGQLGAVLMMLANLQGDFGLRPVKVMFRDEDATTYFVIELAAATP